MDIFRNSERLKGSTLVFSLIVLSFFLISALSVATIAISEKKASFSTEKSNISLQVADSGAEAVLKKIYKDNPSTPDGLGDCDSGVIAGSVGVGDYAVSLYDNDDNRISCSATDWRAEVARLKSQGIYANTTRVITVEVEPLPPAPLPAP